MSGKTAFASPDAGLMKALKFSSKDLDANRDGLLTEGQKKRVWRWQFLSSLPVWAFAFCLAYPLTQIYRQPGWSFREMLVICLWFGVVLLYVGAAFWLQSRTLRVLSAGKVSTARGPIRRSIAYMGKSGSAYSISTPEKELQVSCKSYTVFCDREDYTLYYLPEIDYLLSAEHHPRPMPDPANAPQKPLPKRSGKGH